MAHQIKSRAVIIVNYEFHGSQLRPRPGARREADRLFRALANCNYAVQLHFDLTAEEIKNVYEEERHADHGDYFVSILSSHGEEGIIYDCNGEMVELASIFQALSSDSCPNLAGKPKIFFVQACRGHNIDHGVQLQTDSGDPQMDCFSHYLSIPEDTAVMFASSPGYAAFINRWESMFLKALLDLLEGEERHLELSRLMTRISRQVAFHAEARGQHRGGKEMPCFVSKMLQEAYPFSSQRRAVR
uniref:Caspase-3 n=1 Tax=Salvator merianae TaxID=96440 RepID=A0A8D0BAN4_SALMN